MHAYTAVISSLAENFISELERDFNVIPLPPDTLLDVPVRCHADMLLFTIQNKIILPTNYADAYPHIVETLTSRCAAEIITTTSPRGKKYPLDISLNVLQCASYAFSLKQHTAPEVTSLLEKAGIVHENIHQGYAACSTLAAGESLVSADPTVLRAAQKYGIDTLEISSGHIRIEGYDEGFIGGASGVCENTVYFLGNILTHPDGEKIREFLKVRGFEVVSLGEGELCDFGGIKFIKNLGSDL